MTRIQDSDRSAAAIKRPCRHRLDAAPCEKSLAQNPGFSIEEVSIEDVPSYTSFQDLKSSKDVMILWPNDLVIGASLREEVVLGVKHVVLELELSFERDNAIAK